MNTCFISIHGSPTPKIQLVKTLIEEHGYDKKNTCLIGDSINDFEAAKANNISFYGYNNEDLNETGIQYIDKLQNFNFN